MRSLRREKERQCIVVSQLLHSEAGTQTPFSSGWPERPRSPQTSMALTEWPVSCCSASVVLGTSSEAPSFVSLEPACPGLSSFPAVFLHLFTGPLASDRISNAFPPEIQASFCVFSLPTLSSASLSSAARTPNSARTPHSTRPAPDLASAQGLSVHPISGPPNTSHILSNLELASLLHQILPSPIPSVRALSFPSRDSRAIPDSASHLPHP